MAKITIIGAGAMSGAFSVPCNERNHEVSIVGTHLEDEFIVSVAQYNVTLVSSSSLLNLFSITPSQSLQARNFSTIHAASPAGESVKP